MGKFVKAADATEEVRPGNIKRIADAVLKGTRKKVLETLEKMLKMAAKYGRVLAVLVYAIEPAVALLKSGGEFTPEVKKAFVKAFIALLTNEAAAIAIGAIIGSVVPGPGTILGVG